MSSFTVHHPQSFRHLTGRQAIPPTVHPLETKRAILRRRRILLDRRVRSPASLTTPLSSSPPLSSFVSSRLPKLTLPPANSMKDQAEHAVSDAAFAKASERWPQDVPTTKEAYFIRDIFDGLFPSEAAASTAVRSVSFTSALLHHPSNPP